MYRSRTPKAAARSRSARSTRSSRGSAKRRRGKGGGFADQIRRAAESGPTRKWVKVMRAPAPHIRFQVAKWIPLNELSEEERKEYDKRQMEEQRDKEGEQQQTQPLGDYGTTGVGQTSLLADKDTDPKMENSEMDASQSAILKEKNESDASHNELSTPPSKRMKMNDSSINSTEEVPKDVGMTQDIRVASQIAAPSDSL